MRAWLEKWRRACVSNAGFSLVEMLVALALLGMISLSIANFLVKSNVTATSVSTRVKEADEVHAVIDDIRQDLLKGAYISPNSYDLRLEYTVPADLTTGTATKKVYRIITSGSAHYLQLSTDGGTTWGSPYGVAAYTKYDVGPYAKFLYADIDNNCADMVDTDLDGLSDSLKPTPCMSQPATLAWGTMWYPTQAASVVLRNFRFTTNTGVPTASHPMPYTSTGKEWNNTTMSWVASMDNSDIFLKVNPPLVRSNTSPPSPYVKDPLALQSFSTNTAASMYGTDFDIRAITWDPSRRRLILAGHNNGTDSQIFVADRNGVIMGDTLGRDLSDPSLQVDGVAIEGNGKIILVLDGTNRMIYRYNLNSPGTLSPISSLDLSAFTLTTLDSIAFDPSTPDDVYIVGWNNTNSRHEIWEINKRTGATVATWPITGYLLDPSWHPPAGFFIEPLTGDFLVTSKHPLGTASDPLLPIFRINRGTSALSLISLHLTDLGILSTDPDSIWGLTYDPACNRLFVSSDQKAKVWEIMMDQLITARQ